MSSQYKNHDNGSIVLAGGLIPPGKDVPNPTTEVQQKKYDELVAIGLLIDKDAVAEVPEPEKAPEPPVTPPAPETTTETEAPLLRNGTHGIWNFNPDVIKRYGLKRLNALVKDNDSDTDIFEDKTEAVAFMSVDFE